MFDPSFTRSKYGNKLVEVFGRLLLTTIITMIILTMMKKTMIMIVITKLHNQKNEQRNRENRFDGLRLSSNVRLSLILFLI